LVVDSVLEELRRGGHGKVEVWVTEWGVDRYRVRTVEGLERWYAAGLRELLCRPEVPLVTIYGLVTEGRNAGFALATGALDLTLNGRALRSAIQRWKACSEG